MISNVYLAEEDERERFVVYGFVLFIYTSNWRSNGML